MIAGLKDRIRELFDDVSTLESATAEKLGWTV